MPKWLTRTAMLGGALCAAAGAVMVGADGWIEAASSAIRSESEVASPEPEVASPFPLANRDAKDNRAQLPPRWIGIVADVTDRMPEAAAATSLDTANLYISDPILPPLAPGQEDDAESEAEAPKDRVQLGFLGDAQIAAVKTRLKLTKAQEQNWPPVEAALRNLGRRIHEANRRTRQRPGVPFQIAVADVVRLQSAAGPLLKQLNQDQRRELRMLAHLVGLESQVSKL